MVRGASWGVLGVSGRDPGASWEGLGLPLLPQRPRNNSAPERFTLPIPPQTSLNLTSFFVTFFAPSWLPLGLHFGSLLGAQIGLSSAQVAS